MSLKNELNWKIAQDYPKMKVDSPNYRNGKVQSAYLGTICDLIIVKF